MQIEKLDWGKMQGLIPAVVQDVNTGQMLMLGYMNLQALEQTLSTKRVTFFSRKKNTLWVKGETSGNTLQLCNIFPDCDNDSLLIIAQPMGPTCHKETTSCYGERSASSLAYNMITRLETMIAQREKNRPEESYVAKLLNTGIGRIAQKVGEEGVEVALAAVIEDKLKLTEEVADLLFHVLVLLKARDLSFDNVLSVLMQREGR